MHRKPRIGLALGSGSARGWSQIGVIRELERAGISPEIVCGTSIGALVGAAYAAGEIDRLHDWVKGLRWQAVVSMIDLRMNGGLIEGGKLVEFFRTHFRDEGIERLPKAFGCVATELASGREIWLREGPVIDAVRASIALPGLFTPVERDGRLLVDGGLVNPVPVSLCRAMGADIVIAVDLNWDLIGRRCGTGLYETSLNLQDTLEWGAYYRLEGWDTKTGWPTERTLAELDLGFVTEALKAAGRLGKEQPA